MSVTLTPPGPELCLLVSLAPWTWPGVGPDGREIAHILITHTPALTDGGTAVTVEDRMRRLSTCFGGLAGVRSLWRSRLIHLWRGESGLKAIAGHLLRSCRPYASLES